MNHYYVVSSTQETGAVVQRSYYCAEICHCSPVEKRVWYLTTPAAPGSIHSPPTERRSLGGFPVGGSAPAADVPFRLLEYFPFHFLAFALYLSYFILIF